MELHPDSGIVELLKKYKSLSDTDPQKHLLRVKLEPWIETDKSGKEILPTIKKP